MIVLIFCIVSLLIEPLYAEEDWAAASVYYPTIYEIKRRHNHCLNARFERGDFATFELFIIDADEDGYPKASVSIDGPVISPKVGVLDPESGIRSWPVSEEDKTKTKTLGAAMKRSIDAWPAFINNNRKHFTEAGIIHHNVIIDYTYSGEEEDARAAQADYSRQRNEDIERRRRRNLERDERREAGEVSGDENVEDYEYEEETYAETIIPEFIEPWEWTKPIKSGGWYMMCVHAVDNDITVEMNIRSSAELGGINRETGHVYTFEEHMEIEEEKRIMELENRGPSAEEVEAKLVAEQVEKALKDQVKENDMESTKKLMNEMNQLVNKLQKKQSAVHHRIKGHEGDARRNRKKIFRNGMAQTVLFLVITLFQVYTIHNWLLSSSTLGRA